MPFGIVMRSTGSRYRVRAADGSLHECVAKGILRTKDWNSTNPLAVGDRVEFDPQTSEDGVGAITGLHDRKNFIVRRSVNLSHHKHVLAANMDQALLMVTLARPRTSYGFIDRFLVTAEVYRVPVTILFNKADSYDEEEMDLLAEYESVYQNAGYATITTSAVTRIGLCKADQLLRGKTSLLAGHSGVGKSSLINAIDPSLDLHTMEISDASGKGQHTTTNAEMFELKSSADNEAATGNGGTAAPSFVIDTPGIKGFGLVDMSQAEIVDQFPEFFQLRGACRFGDCTHINEPGCAVKKGVEDGTIAESRYRSYLDMVQGIDDESAYRVG